MKTSLFLLVLITFSTALFAQDKSYWQQKVDFNISITLDDSTKSLEGFETIDYYNNSPDTLKFIWFHLWMNAYKNDRTAFSDQLLENGRTDFYFADENKRGYINQLNFKVEDIVAITQNHPLHQDIIKLVLPTPLAPYKKITITSPFHVQLPFNLSRGGYIDHSFQITQWYPKPAVYDKTGWHEMPYLDQGEFYSEFGDYNVNIIIPEKYIVASTGELTNEVSLSNNKSLTYQQKNIHDFAWFADKDFIVEKDTLQINERIINLNAYHYKRDRTINTIQYLKNAIRTKSKWIGDYPFNTVSVVESLNNNTGGMEYPTITYIDKAEDHESHDLLINHEVGHNWFYGILASNERKSPWMDEGFNTYYDSRYSDSFYASKKIPSSFFSKRLPDDWDNLLFRSLCKTKKDQPITTTSENFNETNYNLIAYTKTSLWLKELEIKMGRSEFDQLMKVYFEKWKFKHPSPDDFKLIVNQNSKIDLSEHFKLLDKKGLLNCNQKRNFKLYPFFSFNKTDKFNYLFFAPAIGFNHYDKVMPGLILHNYTLPANKLQFLIAPLYSKSTKDINGSGKISLTTYMGNYGGKFIFTIDANNFNNNKFVDSTGNTNYLRYSKLNPSIKFVFGESNSKSTLEKSICLSSYFINETNLNFYRDTTQQQLIVSYPIKKRTLNQLSINISNNRALYPYNGVLLAEQGNGFLKLGFTGNYYFNYVKGGGLSVRMYAGKFMYTKEKTFLTEFETSRYHLNMSGANGFEDYTYSNYFLGRNEFEGFYTRQLMMKEGAFKVHTDLLSEKIGKTDNWLGALNITSTIPIKINLFEALPFKLPIRVFCDIGTYAEAWEENHSTEKLLYDAGFQITLLKDIINIYFPVMYSKSYRDYFKSVLNEKIFSKNISFSIDLQKLTMKNFLPKLNL